MKQISKLLKIKNMKNSIIQLFSYSVIMLLSMNSVNAQFNGGTGKYGDPYQIATAAQLAKLAELVNAGTGAYATAYYKLMTNINLKDYQSGAGWIPIGTTARPFKGSFNGNRYKITGLQIFSTNLENVGLFGYVKEGRIYSLKIEKAGIWSEKTKYAGIVAGQVEKGSIEYCATSGGIIGNSTANIISVGGIAGILLNSKLFYSYSTATVAANCDNHTSIAGGLVGQAGLSSIERSYSTGYVQSHTYYGNYNAGAGGIAGVVDNSNVYYCAALNPQIFCKGGTTPRYGRVVGFVEGEIKLLNNMAFDKMINPTDGTTWQNIGHKNYDGESYTRLEINTDGTLGRLFWGLYFFTTENLKLPGVFGSAEPMPLHLQSGDGSENDPFLIYSYSHLEDLSKYVSDGKPTSGKYFKVLSDIKNETGSFLTPIGTKGNGAIPFKGNFDGNKHTITGLRIRNNEAQNIGLFGCVEGATIKNLGLEDVEIRGNNTSELLCAGGLAGSLDNSTVVNCYVTGTVDLVGSASSTVSSIIYAGGLAGHSFKSAISNCYSATDVTCFSKNGHSRAGGLVGENYGGTISNCYALWDIRSSTHSSSSNYNAITGGIAGRIFANGKISNCAALTWNAGENMQNNPLTGRVVGQNMNGTLENNIAFDNMYKNCKTETWTNQGLTGIDGKNINKEDINNQETLGGRFMSPGWTTEKGKLPGLFGKTVEMPVYLQLEGIYKFWNWRDFIFYSKIVMPDIFNPDPINWLEKRFILMNDIVFPFDQTWTPIGFGDYPFMGEFDGNGKKIIGLKVANGEQNQLGLFGFVSGATIKNLGMEDLQIEITNPSSYQGLAQIGGIAAYMNNTTMTNCYTTGVIKASEMGYMGAVCGGLAGSVEYNTTIKNCYSTAAVTSESDVPALAGGIAGYMSDSEIANSYSTGRVRSSSKSESCSGGVVADVSGSAAVRNCAALNPAIDCDGTGTKKYGRIAGRRTGSSTVIANSIAFNKMKNPTGGTTWSNTGLTNTDGADYTAKEVSDSPTLGNRFTDTNGWTSKKGYLPGLFKKEVTMPPYLRFDALPPSIIVQPQNASVAQNYVYYIEVIAQAGDDGALTYQWYKNTTPTNTGGTPVQDATDERFQPNTETLGTFYYYVVITNTIEDNGNGGNLQEKITSNAMTLTVIPVGINENDNLANIRVYPNPTNGMVTISGIRHCGLDPQSPTNVEIFDVMGRVVTVETWHAASLQPTITFNLSTLPSGVYFIRITTDNGVITKKVIKK